jgi:RNA polymerase sigma factor (sigma-70 family)
MGLIMSRETKSIRRTVHMGVEVPSYVHHRSFKRKTAAKVYDPKQLLGSALSEFDKYMPDEVTKQHAKLMHYAAFRMHTATRASELATWQGHFNALRDRVVLGNRKLIYRAVRRRMGNSPRIDDFIGDCHIVLIQAVQVFNPWLGIRFSTYAYTCIVRALSRMAQRCSTDWLSRSLSYDALPNGEPGGAFSPELVSNSHYRLEEFFKDDHPLLTDREKGILSRRFSFRAMKTKALPTLESVGAEMGLSKERVRQVQTLALEKLRGALLAGIN